ncbi:MAG: hypothetical protein QNK35_14990 [Bacteroides sp.]|nr:hypothetical protein [Bacteroides sp.]
MKSLTRVFTILLMAVFPLSILAQDATIVLNYMKVNPGMTADYIQAEQGWKKLHEKRIEAGVMNGWQLWRNVYATPNDPYQFITIDWYNDIAHSLAGDPEGFWQNEIEGVFAEGEAAEIWEMTANSRTLVGKDVMHRIMEADNATGSSYIIVNRMKVKEGKGNAYLQAEGKYSKPLQEAKIDDGQMVHWSVWTAWPYKEGQVRYSTVDGYSSLDQVSAGGNDLLEKVFPDMTWTEWMEKVSADRTLASVELWELVDFAFPPAPEE